MGKRGNTRITRSLQKARAVQLGMLPPPPDVDELQVGVYYQAAEELGGDFYDFIQVSPTQLGVVLADVSGHGVDAALMMAAAKKTLQIHGRRNPSPAEVLKIACEDLADDLPRGTFITVWYGVFDLRSGELRYASAGHNPLLHRRGPNVEARAAKGVVIGAAFVTAIRDILEEQTLQLGNGDAVLLYTDGVNEALNRHDEQYGMARLLAAVKDAPDPAPQPLLRHVRDDVEDFCAGREADDDVTLLALRYRGASQPALPTTWAPRIESNLPARTNSFVGREQEVQATLQAIQDARRLVSIVGFAGLGKTRLALEVARELAPNYPGGAWFVPLAATTDRDAVLTALAGTLEIRVTEDDAVTQLARALALRPPTVVIFDNAETAIESVRELVQPLLQIARNVVFLITSQVRVGLSREHEVALRPLDSPGSKARGITPDAAQSWAAVRLFTDRARSANAEFALDDDNAGAVAAICAELEGMPLAIELAATRMNALSPHEVLRQLKTPTSKIALLRSKTNDLALPYQSLREALQWSFAQLTDSEQVAFQQLCGFKGGFFLEAAESVVTVPSGRSVIDAVDGLLDKSFLIRETTPFGTRFTTYAALREFSGHLTDLVARREFSKRHLAYFSAYASRWIEQALGPRQLEAVQRLEIDRDNLLEALQRAYERYDEAAAATLLRGINSAGMGVGGGARMPALLQEFRARFPNAAPGNRVAVLQILASQLTERGNARDALAATDEALQVCKDLPGTAHAALARLAMARVRNMLGDDAQSESDFKQAIAEYDALGDAEFGGQARVGYATLLSRQGRKPEARELLADAEKLFEKTGDANYRGVALCNRVMMNIDDVHLEEARKELDLARSQMQRVNNRQGMAVVSLATARILERDGQLEEALEQFHRTIEMFREIGLTRSVAITLMDIGGISLGVGDLDAAREAGQEALKLGQETASGPTVIRAKGLLGLIQLDEGDHAAALATFAEVDQLLSATLESTLKISTRVYMACAQLGTGDNEGAAAGALAVLQSESELERSQPRELFLAIAVRARALANLGRATTAAQAQARAQELAARRGMNPDSLNVPIRLGFQLLAPAPQPRGLQRVRCAVCGQRYQGSANRIRSLAKCLKCGTMPFAGIKVAEKG